MPPSYCSMDTAPRELRDQLAENYRIVVMEDGEPVAVIVSIEDFRSMQATIALANDPKELQHVLDRADAMSAFSESYADAGVREG